ncbi:desmethyl-deoxy-podophyllotoxin synthase-like [Lolium perenne]|uniref:desmethyl-deoxy-podophyllotoxin synthase-like n=1 Tax=Lolium perenne TaxID=4522 RepID=UPI0021E9EFB4|nr:desmethyl-deoxy-podophyllotoxin synthase-like [Lolium perenne]
MGDTFHLYCVPVGLALVSLLLVFARYKRSAAHGLRLPPGPWKLPVIGSLHHLVGKKLLHRALRDLALRHGPVMLLRLGEVPTLVVSSREAAREVMKSLDTTFATRPLTSPTLRVLSSDGRDIVFAPYGEYWRQLRKIAVTELLSVRRVLSFRAIREEEVAAMLRSVEAAAADGRPVQMRARLSALMADITVRAVIGDTCKDRDVLLREVDHVVELATGLNPADLWPSSWLVGRLFGGSVRRTQEVHDTMFRVIDGIIQEHLLERKGEEEAQDLLDVLLKIHKDDGGLDMLAVKAVIFDIFSAGMETSSTALEWAVAELIKNPRVMAKATAEVRRAFEAGGTVMEQALGDQLPYLSLVIRETLRLHPPFSLLLPRECREACQVLGYDVPRGTQVLVNAWALGRDKRYWPNAPEEFRPERFEGEEGSAAGRDFRGTDFELLPFGAGRRMCPGISFGLANVELPLASLLLHFQWNVVSGSAEQFDMTEAFGATTRLKANLLLRPVLRVPLPRL